MPDEPQHPPPVPDPDQPDPDPDQPTGPAKDRPRTSPRTMLRRIIGSETITEPLPVVDRLKNTPYRNPVATEQSREDGVRRSLELIADIGAALLSAGSGSAEVSTSMLAVGVALGAADGYLTTDITYTTVMVSYGKPGDWPVTLIRVAGSPSRDYSRLTEVHSLVVDMVDGHLDRPAARRRLDALLAAPRPYQRRWVTLAWGVMAALVVFVLGGGPVHAGVGFAVTTIVDRVGRWSSRQGWPPFFVTFFGAGLAASAAVGLAEASQRWPLGIGNAADSALIVAGGIMVLLAGTGLVAAVQDALTGYPITAAGRLLEVVLTTSAILAGVGVALSFATRLGLAGAFLADPFERLRVGLTWWVAPLAAVVALASAIGGRAPLRLLPVTALVGGLTYATYQVMVLIGAAQPLATAIAATLAGSLGRVWALRRRASPISVVGPATTMLLPGLTIFRGLQLMATNQALDGLVTLLGAGATGLAIAAGSVLGDALAAPLEKGMASLDEIRARLARDI